MTKTTPIVITSGDFPIWCYACGKQEKYIKIGHKTWKCAGCGKWYTK